jgi:hypothetical protein
VYPGESLGAMLAKNADRIDDGIDFGKARQPNRFFGVPGKVGIDEGQPRVADGWRRAAGAHNVMAIGQQRVQQVLSDETACACQQDLHALSF